MLGYRRIGNPRYGYDKIFEFFNRGTMIRIREILDPELRASIVSALAVRRGCAPSAIPDWFELDDADFVDLLHDLREEESSDDRDDSRM